MIENGGGVMADVDLKPAPKLSGEQLEQVTEAIVDAFDYAGLTIVLRFKWGITLANYVNTAQGFYGVVANFLTWTEQRGKTHELMALVYAERPGNAIVQQVTRSLGLSFAEASEKYDPAKPKPAKPPLEAMVARHSRFVDFETFLRRFQSLGDRICRIETPATLGTGFLVGPDLVLTNFHVVESLGSDLGDRAICQFDVREGSDTGTSDNTGEKKTGHIDCKLAPDWLLAKSRYSESDIGGTGEPAPDQLDYALLRLSKNIGAAPVAADAQRGWFNLSDKRPLVTIRDFIVIPQHPRGRRLEVAWGSVLNFNGSGTRVRYDATTDAGSSGSPCLTVDLEIFGLHHAAAPRQNPEYNQAIPLELIASDLKTKSII